MQQMVDRNMTVGDFARAVQGQPQETHRRNYLYELIAKVDTVLANAADPLFTAMDLYGEITAHRPLLPSIEAGPYQPNHNM